MVVEGLKILYSIEMEVTFTEKHEDTAEASFIVKEIFHELLVIMF